MKFSSLLKQRHSIRDYLNKKAPLSLIEEILKEACLAPSARNLQPWQFIIIENEKMLKKLSDGCKNSMMEDIAINPDSFFKNFEKLLKDPNYNLFHNAPTLVIIGGNKNSPTLTEDCTLFASYFMLGAAERQLGTCWIGLAKLIKDRHLRKEIGMTDDFEIVAPIIIGYPSSFDQKNHNRKPPDIIKTIS
jgi:nitroreductase